MLVVACPMKPILVPEPTAFSVAVFEKCGVSREGAETPANFFSQLIGRLVPSVTPREAKKQS